MSNVTNETIADIVAEMMDESHAGYASFLEWVGAKLRHYADRIEAAYKREREAGADADQICGKIGEMIGREAAKNQSVTNCNQLGNVAKMRDALEKADAALSLISKSSWFVDANFAETIGVIEAGKAIQAALSAPPRNCDVGTAEEQEERFTKFCGRQDCKRTCPLSDEYDLYRCEFAWGQMPYEEGDNE